MILSNFVFSRYVNDHNAWPEHISRLTKSHIMNFGVGNFNRSSPSSIGFQVSNKTEENIVSPRRHLNLETRSSQQQQSNRSNRAAINSRDVTQIRDNYFDDKIANPYCVLYKKNMFKPKSRELGCTSVFLDTCCILKPGWRFFDRYRILNTFCTCLAF